ncbi:hypothetical protein LCGC14_1040710 [marine sediment metagenome]|uniref:Uncharacterized protein n=1 Tax=marine sediment metagenome TaxID=412755 RepID=A0A0F9Q9Z7_9ZZZZ
MNGIARLITSLPAYVGMYLVTSYAMRDNYSNTVLAVAMLIVVYADVVGYIQGKLSS